MLVLTSRELKQYADEYSASPHLVTCPECGDSKDVTRQGVNWSKDGRCKLTFKCAWCEVVFNLLFKLDEVNYEYQEDIDGKRTDTGRKSK